MEAFFSTESVPNVHYFSLIFRYFSLISRYFTLFSAISRYFPLFHAIFCYLTLFCPLFHANLYYFTLFSANFRYFYRKFPHILYIIDRYFPLISAIFAKIGFQYGLSNQVDHTKLHLVPGKGEAHLANWWSVRSLQKVPYSSPRAYRSEG